ncbi:MAG: NFACT family protein, partial [Nitrospiria bacterium]
MSLSAIQLEKILTEIAEPLKGGRLQRIDQPQPWGLLFQIDQKGRRYRLYFSAHQRYSRFHLVTGVDANPQKPPQFCQLLRAHLRYKRISALHLIAGDRIVQMHCAWTEKDASADVSLIAELM